MGHVQPGDGIRTRAVHAGERPDPVTRASAPNLVMSTTFVIDDAEAKFSAKCLSDESPYAYTRWGNPTVAQLESKLANLEGGEAAVAFATGMAAATALLLHRLRGGDHLIVSEVAYAGVAELMHDTLPGLGVLVTKVDLSDLDELKRAIRPNTKLIYAETPANPILKLTDIKAVARIAHQAGAELAVDSTFATPIALRPIELGADYVLHSLTKYLCGHGDALGGVLVGRTRRMADIRQDTAIHLGGSISPFNAWLIMRGMATLPIRMKAHEEGALQVAKFLEKHRLVTKVVYPGLPSHPQYKLARKQMANMSGMLTFQVKDGLRTAKQFVKRLRIFHYAVSLGHHRSLIFYLPTADMQTNSFRLEADHLKRFRQWAGDGIFRVSIGLEDPGDLCADLDQALRGK